MAKKKKKNKKIELSFKNSEERQFNITKVSWQFVPILGSLALTILI